MIESLPRGWAWSTMGDLLVPQSDGRTIHQGWSPKCEPFPAAQNAWGVLKTTAIQPGEFQPEHNKELPASKKARPLLEVAAGDILITCAGPRSRCGVAALVRHTPRRLMISGKMYRLRFDPSHLLPEFVEAYLQTSAAWQSIDRLKTGGNESGLNLTQSRFKTLPIPVAPLAEQERIIAAIEEHGSRLDTAEASLQNAEGRLALAEQSSIDAAVQGTGRRLGDSLAEPLRNGYSAARSDLGETRVLTLTAVTKREFVDNHTKLAEVPASKRSALMLRPGDILVQRSNAPELVGSAALYEGPENWAIFPDLLIRVRPDDTLVPSYLELALRCSSSRRYFRNSAQGSAGSMPKISQGTIKDLEVKVPPTVEDQCRAVAHARDRLDAIQRLKAQLARSTVLGSALRRSVLSAAFSGRLVAQDLADEPASALLERIAAEQHVKSRRNKS